MKKRLNLSASGAANHAELEGPFSIIEAVRGRQKLAVQQAACDATVRKPPSDFPEMVQIVANEARIPFLATEEAKPRPSRLRKFMAN